LKKEFTKYDKQHQKWLEQQNKKKKKAKEKIIRKKKN